MRPNPWMLWKQSRQRARMRSWPPTPQTFMYSIVSALNPIVGIAVTYSSNVSLYKTVALSASSGELPGSWTISWRYQRSLPCRLWPTPISTFWFKNSDACSLDQKWALLRFGLDYIKGWTLEHNKTELSPHCNEVNIWWLQSLFWFRSLQNFAEFAILFKLNHLICLGRNFCIP